MKLSDIDVMVNHRTTYQSKKADYDAAMENSSAKIVQIGDRYIKDTVLLQKVGLLVREHTKEKLDEARTKLMMLGIDEFPE